MSFRFLIGVFLSCIAFGVTAAGTSTWQLNAGNYVSAKMPMTLVFPRPDSETVASARQRIAYADGTMQYRIPVAIQGGAYPFHYELISGPTGMTVGTDYHNTNYGVVTWTPTSQGGPYNVHVKVTDQDDNTIDAIWTVTADNSKFIFIDPNAATNGTGTKASPFNTMVGIGIVDGSGTNPLKGKAVILRKGTTNFYGPETSGIYSFLSTIGNPFVFLGYTGEVAALDMSSGYFRNRGQSDVYFGQVTLKNAKTIEITPGGEKDTMVYFDWAKTNRTTFFENRFENIQWNSGTGFGSNQAAILTWNPGILRKYFTVIGNTMDNYNMPLVELFDTEYVVLDKNIFTSNGKAFGGNGGFNIKSDLQNVSIRSNSADVPFNMGEGLIRIATQAQTFPNNNIEVAYNLCLVPDNTNVMRSFLVDDPSAPHIYVYRNTFRGKVVQFDFSGVIVYENNVIVENNSFYGQQCDAWHLSPCVNLTVTAHDYTADPNGNIYGKTSDGFIGQDGALAGTASAYLGKIGFQISDGTGKPEPPSPINIK